jgi:molybdenum cofactor biosynthesis enzyme MoaA
MRAANLTISVPNNGCDKNCPYCVSKMTGFVDPNVPLMLRNINKVKTLARAAQVTNVLFTGKGEPTLNWDILVNMIKSFREWPTELQTNGFYLSQNCEALSELAKAGLDVVAVSIDKIKQFDDFRKLFKNIRGLGMTVRVTLNITRMIPEAISYNGLISLCKSVGVEQFLLRNIVAPTHAEESRYTKWISMNTSQAQYDRLEGQMKMCLETEGKFLRETEFGMRIYDYRGVSVTSSDYCIQDTAGPNTIRSLIFLDDGHCYTTWYSKASRLF